MGGWGWGGWGVGGWEWGGLGGAPTHMHMHAHAHGTRGKHDNFMQMAAPIGGIP